MSLTLVIVNKPVVNTGVQISVSVFVFSQKESDMTERLHFTSPRIGGPHGNSFFFHMVILHLAF